MRSHRFRDWLRCGGWAGPAVLVGTFLLTCVHANAQVLLPEAWQFDGQVYSVARSGNTLYVGGNFKYCGPVTGPVVAMHPTTGVLDETFPRVDGQVLCAAADGKGGWFIGGSLARVGTVAVGNIAHVRADHSVDDWAPQCGMVESIHVFGDRLYIGGAFGTVNGSLRSHVAAFDLETLELLDWSPSVEGGPIGSGEVLSIAAIDSTVYLGGWFGLVNGQPRATVAAVNARTGELFEWNPGSVEGAVLALLPNENTVLVAGQFDQMGGAARRAFAEIDRSTGLATAWSPLTFGAVTAMATDGARLWIGGYFEEFSGVPRKNLACVSLATHEVTSWDAQLDERVNSLSWSNDRLYVAGEFSRAAGQNRLRAAAFEGASGILTGWNPSVGGSALAVIPGANAVMLAGSFASAGGVARSSLAAIDLTTGRATDWAPQANNYVRGLDVSGGTVYVVGPFTQLNGEARAGVAALDPASGMLLSWNPGGFTGSAEWVKAGPSAVYVAGTFTQVGGVGRRNLAALDPVSGAVTSWDPQLPDNAVIAAFEKTATRLYVGGSFASIGGQARGRAAAFDFESGVLLPWNPQVSSGYVLSLSERDSDVYLGGNFFEVGGQARQHFAVVDRATAAPRSWTLPLDATVRAVALGRRSLFLAGDFSNGSLPPTTLAAWDLQTHQLRQWMPTYGWTSIRSMLAFGDTLVVFGNFLGMAGSSHQGLAIFLELQDSLPPIVSITQPGPGSTFVIGQQIDIRWTTTDESPTASESVFLSRTGPGGPWTLLGTGSGQAQWTVTGPRTDNAFLRVVSTDLMGNVGEDVLDWPFRIVPTDTIPPQVRVTWPNGFEQVSIGSTVDLRWLTSDNVEVTSARVSISRQGPTGPWEGLAEMYPSYGVHSWLVNGPPSVLSAWVLVEAWDAAGNKGSDVSDHEFSILDGPVPTIVELFQAVPTPLGSRLQWRLADPSRYESVELQRSAGDAGEWTTLARAPVEVGTGEYLDAAAPEVALYRLAGRERSGAAFATAPIRVEIDAVRALTLYAPAPNPTRGSAWISFGLPRAGQVKLSLLDMQGRERGVLASGARTAGRHVAQLDARDLEPGLYFLRLATGSEVRTRKFAIVR